MQADGPNAEQIRYWNDTGGRKWVAMQAMLDAQIDALGRAALEALDVGPGERVIDVGCGCGQSTLELAERVGADGHVLGVDVSEPMAARARERARAAGHAHVEVVVADAQTHAFTPAAADAAFSRFGVMFFADPAAAFANLHAALRPGGRLAFVCWQPLQRNPWMLVPAMAAAQHVALPPPPAPDAPGPFAFGDGERLTGLLARGGLARIAVTPLETTLALGGTDDLDAAVDFALQLGRPIAEALRDASDAVVAQVRGAVRESLAPWWSADGGRMPAAAWVVTAERA